MPSRVIDPFTSGALDPKTWQVLELPAGEGRTWAYRDREAVVKASEGTLEITVDPFRLKHDSIHMFDDPKHLVATVQPVALKPGGITTFACEMACENHRGNPDDLLDGFAMLMLGDFKTGMIFDFAISGTRIGAIYERLPIPGVTPADGAFTYLVQSPFTVQNHPREFHRYEISIDPDARRAEWRVDGTRFFVTRDVPVAVESLTIGAALCTLKAPVPGKGSISTHGQGATGLWRNLNVQTAD